MLLSWDRGALMQTWKGVQSKALLSRSVFSPQPSVMGRPATKSQLFWLFPTFKIPYEKHSLSRSSSEETKTPFFSKENIHLHPEENETLQWFFLPTDWGRISFRNFPEAYRHIPLKGQYEQYKTHLKTIIKDTFSSCLVYAPSMLML